MPRRLDLGDRLETGRLDRSTVRRRAAGTSASASDDGHAAAEPSHDRDGAAGGRLAAVRRVARSTTGPRGM